MVPSGVSRPIIFRPEAEAEVTEAIEWYEARGRGLGGEFLRSLEAALVSVQRDPKAFSLVFGRARRALLRRYPYSLIYVASESVEPILVVACFHVRRDPRRWQDRL